MAIIAGDDEGNVLTGAAEDDRILGLDGNDRLFGRAGRDILEGGDGRDRLFGGGGDDLLLGGAGSDRLVGGAGDDILVGGLGPDTLVGGAGADVFRFDDLDAGDVTAGSRADVIADFSAEDAIDLLAVDVLFFDGFGNEPSRGGFSIWQAAGSTYVTWQTYGGFHDIELAGYTGDPFELLNQIRWYEDDYTAGVNTTARIVVGETLSGVIEMPDDEDWFQVTLAEGQVYTFEMSGAAGGGSTLHDPYLVLLDAEGNFVADDDNGSGTFDARLQVAGAGTYFIVARNAFDGSAGTYSLAVTAEAYVDDYGGGTGTSGAMSLGETLTGEIEVRGDQDWFRITLAEGETYVIDLRGADSGAGTLPDPFLVLRDADGTAIADDDDGSGTFDSRLVFTADATGTYFIDARELGDGTGTYELSVTVADDPLLIV